MILASAAANLERKLAGHERLANKRPTGEGPGSQVGQFALSVGVGPAGGVIGTALLWLLLRKLRLDEMLGTSAQLATVIAVAAGCDILPADTGLIAAIFMGLALANQRGFDVPGRRPFFEALVQLIIGVLFISISATVTPQSLRHLVLPTLGLVAVLVFVARPIVAFASARGTDLKKGERAFIGGMAPRGIVAAATPPPAVPVAQATDGRLRRQGSGYGAGITRCG